MVVKPQAYFLFIFSLAWTACLPASATAEQSKAVPAHTAAQKLHRGTLNVITGISEGPRNIDQTWREAGWLEALTYGAARGTGLAIARTAAGFYEMLTFYSPAPRDYEPLMEPEYLDPVLSPSAAS